MKYRFLIFWMLMLFSFLNYVIGDSRSILIECTCYRRGCLSPMLIKESKGYDFKYLKKDVKGVLKGSLCCYLFCTPTFPWNPRRKRTCSLFEVDVKKEIFDEILFLCKWLVSIFPDVEYSKGSVKYFSRKLEDGTFCGIYITLEEDGALKQAILKGDRGVSFLTYLSKYFHKIEEIVKREKNKSYGIPDFRWYVYNFYEEAAVYGFTIEGYSKGLRYLYCPMSISENVICFLRDYGVEYKSLKTAFFWDKYGVKEKDVKEVRFSEKEEEKISDILLKLRRKYKKDRLFLGWRAFALSRKSLDLKGRLLLSIITNRGVEYYLLKRKSLSELLDIMSDKIKK